MNSWIWTIMWLAEQPKLKKCSISNRVTAFTKILRLVAKKRKINKTIKSRFSTIFVSTPNTNWPNSLKYNLGIKLSLLRISTALISNLILIFFSMIVLQSVVVAQVMAPRPIMPEKMLQRTTHILKRKN